MADDLNTIARRRVYSDGTDGTAATPLPVQAQQAISNASAGVVQPGGTAPAPTLNAANPVQPAVMPVAAPAAAAAAAAPVTPVPAAVPDPNLQNYQKPTGPVAPTYGAAQIPTGNPMIDNQPIAPAAPAAPATTMDRTQSWLHNNLPGNSPLASLDAFAGGFGGAASEMAGLMRANAMSRAAVIKPGAAVAPVIQDATHAGRAAQAGVTEGKVAQAAANDAAAGVKVTEGPNLSGVGTPLSAAEKEAQAVAAGQRAAGQTAAKGTTTVAPNAAVVGGQPAAAAANAGKGLSTAQKVMFPAAVAGGVGTPLYVAGQPDAPLPPVPGAPAAAPVAGGSAPLPYTVPGGGSAGTDTADPAAAGPPASLNDIKRVGNSYSGTNIGPDATINGKVPTNPVGYAYSGDHPPTPEEAEANHQRNMAGYASDLAHIREMNDLRVARDRGWSGVIGTSPGDNAFGVGMSKDEREQFNEDAAMNWATSKKDKTLIEAAKIPIEARQKRQAETLRAANEYAKTQLTTQAENARSAATNAITMAGHQMTAQTARENNRATTLASIYGADSRSASENAKLRFEAMKSDRDYQHTLTKEGKEVADKEFDIRNKAVDTITKRAQSMRPASDKDGAAKDAMAVMDYVSDIKDQLQEQVNANPNDKEAAAMLDKYKRYGAQNLDDKLVHNLIKGSQLTEKVNAANAKDPSILMNMWRGTNKGVVSNEPFRGIKKISRPNAPDVYVETDEQGHPLGRDRRPLPAGSNDYGRVLPASVVEKDEGLWGTGFFAKPSNDFRTLTH